MTAKPVVSAIVCTHNPRPALFEWVLTSLQYQTLPRDQFEVLIVDNCSATPLDERRLRANRNLNLRLLREPKLGITPARVAGILGAQADLLVFVDDDNYLLPDYLEQAIGIAARQPEIGHFGGIAMALHEEPITAWQKRFLVSLGIRDNGPEPITARHNWWGDWEPIGAGMVCWRPIAERFTEFVRSSNVAQLLGRKGSGLMSGEDTLFARIAVDMGYACSYQPALRLFHFVRSRRLRPDVLARTLLGHGRSHVLLEELSRRPIQRTGYWDGLKKLAGWGPRRLREEGFPAGLIQWCWDVGFFLQLNSSSPPKSGAWLAEPVNAAKENAGNQSAS